MELFPQYRKSPDTSRELSPTIWYDCPVERYRYGLGGTFHFDDFLADAVTTTGLSNGHGRPFLDASSTITSPSGVGGYLQLFTTADNEEASLQLGGASFVIPAASSSGKKLWFECRIKRLLITDAKGGFFVGLAAQGAGAADFMADAGNDFADVALLGFWNDETDDSVGSHVHLITQKAGAAFDTIVDTVDTLVADTFVKYGFVYDPQAPATQRIKFYVNGTEQTTYVGETATDATVYITDTTNFPGGVNMSPICHVKGAHADDHTVTMDWWAIGQAI